jgi:hypothetical protein
MIQAPGLYPVGWVIWDPTPPVISCTCPKIFCKIHKKLFNFHSHRQTPKHVQFHQYT